MKRAFQKIIQEFDFRDVMFFVGVASLGYGLWLVHPPIMYIVLGFLFILLTTWGGPEK